MTIQDKEAVERLLRMYEEYKAITSELSKTASRLAKAKLHQSDTKALKTDQQELSDHLQTLSDEMTFGNPLIWMAYKFRAYQDEAQPILNMSDLRQHCAKPGYICTKRFQFVNQQLNLAGKPTMDNPQIYPDEQSLAKVLEDIPLVELSQNSRFRQLWEGFEYHRSNGKVAKWQNFKI